MRFAKVLLFLLLTTVSPYSFYSYAQSTLAANVSNTGCDLPLVVQDRSKANMFTEQQEQWLGEILDAKERSDFNAIDDPEGRLQKLGERLLAQLPPTQMHFHFTIIDSPELNSFGVAGGWIYIHRRMISFTQNEDELAGLLGHEIGHVVAHDIAVRVSDWFRQIGITSVGDKQDIFAKWNHFVDQRNKVKSHVNEDNEQLVADRIGLYAMTRAGYDPNRYAEFADRLLETKGKTGSFLSDLLHITSPESKRLRELIKNTAPLAKGCIVPRVADAEHFAKWKSGIIESQRAAVKEELPGLVRKVSLQPRLRDDIEQIQFSRDGKYLLAQDQSSIFVMSREPLANLFRIDAFDAHTAQFSPDSNSVVFYDKELRVEKWDIASQKRTEVHQLNIPGCFENALSPSGDTLACITLVDEVEDFELKLIDVATNKVIYDKPHFHELVYQDFWTLYRGLLARTPLPSLFDMKFSPDGRYFATGRGHSVLIFDLKEQAEAHVPGRIKALLRYTFAFPAADEIAGIEWGALHPELVRLHFPSGEKIDEFRFDQDGRFFSSNSRNYLLIRPAGTYPVGIIDLKEQKIIQAFKSPAFAIYGDTFAGEQNSGEIALFNSGDKKMIGKLVLPDSLLSSSRTAAFSADGRWLAISGMARGSVWKLEDGERVFFMKGFKGALFENGQLIAQFAPEAPNPSRVFEFNLETKGAKKLYAVVDPPKKNHRSFQLGGLLVTLRPENDDNYSRAAIMEVRDVRNNTLLWQQKWHVGHWEMSYSGNALTILTSNWNDIKASASEDPALHGRLDAIKDKQTAHLVLVYEPATGKKLGTILIDTGKHSFDVTHAFLRGDLNRTLVYSVSSGEQKGVLTGHIVNGTIKGNIILMENTDGVADLYSTATLQPVAHFGFPSRIAHAYFAEDGKLTVVTAEQTVYQIAPPSAPQNASAK